MHLMTRMFLSRALPRAVVVFGAAIMTASVAMMPIDASAQSRGKRSAAPPPAENEALPQVVQKQFPLTFNWSLVSINGKPPTGERPSLTIDDNYRGTGFAGCNSYSATTFPLNKQGFATGPVAVTRKTCDPAANASERAFLVALRSANAWDLLGGQFILKTQVGELRFERSI
jgi:heat shock protein HslJ